MNKLYNYQKEFILDKSRFKLGCFSRQTGKTFSTCLDIIDDIAEIETNGGSTNWVILSSGMRQAKESINQGIRKHLHELQFDFNMHEDTWLDDSEYSLLEIRFPNGSKITALPANPSTARGFSANVYLDEFAFHKDSNEIWSALFPCISNGKRIVITSTPNGKNNKFYDIFTSKTNIWSKHVIDIYEAVNQGLNRNIEELRLALDDDLIWRREYLLSFDDQENSYISQDLIYSNISNDNIDYNYKNVYIGIDIATSIDKFSIFAVSPDMDGNLRVIDSETTANTTFYQQDKILERYLNKYSVRKVLIDSTGIGARSLEEYKQRYGSLVEGMHFTINSKLELFSTAKKYFENNKIKIPKDNNLIKGLTSIKRIFNASGQQIFNLDRNSNGHSDNVVALFLAILSYDRNKNNYNKHNWGIII
jgi:phage FluMu gp28-like protein